MSTGRISGGNALRLADDIDRDNWVMVTRRLGAARQEAASRQAEVVLISSELLLAPLAQDDRLSRFMVALEDAGLSKAEFLLVLRDPVDQLISLYKHRAKSGTVGNIVEWCESGYQVPDELAGFRRQVDGSGVKLVVRRYSRESGGLDRIFFRDWLQIPEPEVEMPESVNPSLAFSELALIRELAQTRSDLVPYLYEALATVPKADKPRKAGVEAHARAVAAKTVYQHAEEWALWNQWLPEHEPIVVPESLTVVPPCPDDFGFSEAQLRAVSSLLATSATSGFVARQFWRSKLRPILGRIRQIVLKS
ncbi:MAG: hypothetical protein ACXIUB_05590 [Wenzhouxiangella sp.]